MAETGAPSPLSTLSTAGPAPASPGARERPPVVATDLEGTCSTGETWRAVARWLGEHGRGGRYRRFALPRYAAVPLVAAGLLDRQAFRNRWIRDEARLLAGLDIETVNSMAEDVVERDLWPGRRIALLEELRVAAAEGARIVFASGTYQPVLERFVARLEFPVIALGTSLAVGDGRLTGESGFVGTGARKAARVHVAADGARVLRAYGDSAADIPMLEAADAPVAVAPEKKLRKVALERGWRILEAAP